MKKLSVGKVLRNKWRLDAFLGKGGMADVWAATHRNGMRGAIKVLHSTFVADASIRSRFLREGYVANKVGHPGAVQVIDDDETEEGLAYLVMELLTGESLKDRWLGAGKRLPADFVARISMDVLDTLAAAHAQQIVHRDVKPDNIFLTRDGRTKLLDFGIARLREAGTRATQTGAVLGTPAFMSPEQASSAWESVNGRSDLFSLGATMWTLVTGQFVHAGDSVAHLYRAAATRPARKLGTVAPELPADFSAVVDRALGFANDDRWPDARAMRVALERCRSTGPEIRAGDATVPDGATEQSTAVDVPRSVPTLETGAPNFEDAAAPENDQTLVDRDEPAEAAPRANPALPALRARLAGWKMPTGARLELERELAPAEAKPRADAGRAAMQPDVTGAGSFEPVRPAQPSEPGLEARRQGAAPRGGLTVKVLVGVAVLLVIWALFVLLFFK